QRPTSGQATNKDAPTGKRQRSTESERTGAPSGKRQKLPAKKKKATASEVAKRHLVVALIAQNDPEGKMSVEQWQKVESSTLDALLATMEQGNTAPTSFDGAGWFRGVKILSCKDDHTLKWVSDTVTKMTPPWEGAKLKVVDRTQIPSVPKAKVLFPRVVPTEQALKLLQWQNPDVPTAD
ncbi:hypothetical protein KR054_009334, partial [Drosophila jambulina]